MEMDAGSTNKPYNTLISDDEDHEGTESRSSSCKFIWNTAINPISVRISNLTKDDYNNIKNLKIFFPSEETPLLTTQYENDENPHQTCSIHLLDTDYKKSHALPLPYQEIHAIHQTFADKNIFFNNFTTIKDNQGNTQIAICFSSKHKN